MLSCVKNEHGFIDGVLGKKSVFHDRVQHKFILGKDTDTRRRIGVKC